MFLMFLLAFCCSVVRHMTLWMQIRVSRRDLLEARDGGARGCRHHWLSSRSYISPSQHSATTAHSEFHSLSNMHPFSSIHVPHSIILSRLYPLDTLRNCKCRYSKRQRKVGCVPSKFSIFLCTLRFIIRLYWTSLKYLTLRIIIDFRFWF